LIENVSLFAEANLSATLQAEIWSSDQIKMFVPSSVNSSFSAFLTAIFTSEFLATWTFAPTSAAATLKVSKFLWDVPL